MTADELKKKKKKLEIQYKVLGEWFLYPQYTCHGYTVMSEVYDDGHLIGYQTLWTQKGRLFLYSKFIKADIYPTMERDDD